MQVISTNFLYGYTRLSDPTVVKPKKKKKRLLISGGTRLNARSKGCVYLEGEFGDEKCFRRQQTFLVALIQAVISTVETDTDPIPPFTVTLPAIYIFFF